MPVFKHGNQRKWFHKNVGISYLNSGKNIFDIWNNFRNNNIETGITSIEILEITASI
jgi:hypothetical protein